MPQNIGLLVQSNQEVAGRHLPNPGIPSDALFSAEQDFSR